MASLNLNTRLPRKRLQVSSEHAQIFLSNEVQVSANLVELYKALLFTYKEHRGADGMRAFWPFEQAKNWSTRNFMNDSLSLLWDAFKTSSHTWSSSGNLLVFFSSSAIPATTEFRKSSAFRWITSSLGILDMAPEKKHTKTWGNCILNSMNI